MSLLLVQILSMMKQRNRTDKTEIEQQALLIMPIAFDDL